MLLSLVKQSWTPFVGYAALLVPTLIAALLIIYFLSTQFKLGEVGFPPLPRQALTQFKTDSGLLVNVAADSNHNLELWDAPLPASPYKLPRLALRGSDLRDGFRTLPPP